MSDDQVGGLIMKYFMLKDKGTGLFIKESKQDLIQTSQQHKATLFLEAELNSTWERWYGALLEDFLTVSVTLETESLADDKIACKGCGSIIKEVAGNSTTYYGVAMQRSHNQLTTTCTNCGQKEVSAI